MDSLSDFIAGYRIYVDVLTGKKLSSIYLANMVLNYWSVSLFSWRGWSKEGGLGALLF